MRLDERAPGGVGREAFTFAVAELGERPLAPAGERHLEGEPERLSSARCAQDPAPFTVLGRAAPLGTWATDDERALLAHGELVQFFHEPEQITFAADRELSVDGRTAKVLKRKVERGPPVSVPPHHARERGPHFGRALALGDQCHSRTNANSHPRQQELLFLPDVVEK